MRDSRPLPPDPPDDRVPSPARPRRGDLPHALTFFLTADQRRRVLARLRQLHSSRERALLLGLDAADPPIRPRKPPRPRI